LTNAFTRPGYGVDEIKGKAQTHNLQKLA